jgi:hypothetical protein
MGEVKWSSDKLTFHLKRNYEIQPKKLFDSFCEKRNQCLLTKELLDYSYKNYDFKDINKLIDHCSIYLQAAVNISYSTLDISAHIINFILLDDPLPLTVS